MAKQPAKSDNPTSFADQMAKLESLIDQIESGEIGLEDSIDAYEEGVKLIPSCRGMLSSAEQRVEELTERLAGQDEAEASAS